MPHLPDDDYAPPPKLLRKRLNGVYREDLGFSGPTRRYVMMVALLVVLASVPTLAVITAGSREIAGQDRPGAMDVPFLPPPVTGPVPFPPLSAGPFGSPATPGPPSPDQLPWGYGQSTPPTRPSTDSPTSSPPGPPQESGISPPPGASPGTRTSSPSKPSPNSRTPSTSRPSAPAGGSSRSRPDQPPPDDEAPAPGQNRGRRAVPDPPTSRFPTVPGLPWVPEEDRAPGPDPATEEPPEPTEPTEPTEEPTEPEWPSYPERPRKKTCENDRPTVHERRSPNRPRHSRRSAVTERPHNIRPSRTLGQSLSGGNTNAIGRLLTDANSDESRLANRPYRGMHRAENIQHPDEHSAARDRGSRVGRHHAEPTDDRYFNRR